MSLSKSKIKPDSQIFSESFLNKTDIKKNLIKPFLDLEYSYGKKIRKENKCCQTSLKSKDNDDKSRSFIMV